MKKGSAGARDNAVAEMLAMLPFPGSFWGAGAIWALLDRWIGRGLIRETPTVQRRCPRCLVAAARRSIGPRARKRFFSGAALGGARNNW
eukprot:4500698-Pyramimonas_sp.AAC.1